MESIYFAVAPTGLIKVGRSNDVPQRMTTLGTVLISQFVGVAAYERRVQARIRTRRHRNKSKEQKA